jgi:hypothetical protein
LLRARHLGSSIILSDGYREALCFVVNRPECKAKPEIKNACSDTSEEGQTGGRVIRDVREEEKCIRVWVGKPGGSRTRGRQTYRWEKGIRANLTEIRCVGVYWIEGCCEDG